jgi:hypothetical protein
MSICVVSVNGVITIGFPMDINIAPPIKHCRKDADRDKKYQGTKAQTGWRPSSFCNAEIFYLCQVFLARFSWGSNII